MDMIEFGMACKPLNREYKVLFGTIPTPSNYACTREEYYSALQKAIAEGKPITEYLDNIVQQNDDIYDY